MKQNIIDEIENDFEDSAARELIGELETLDDEDLEGCRIQDVIEELSMSLFNKEEAARNRYWDEKISRSRGQ